MNDRTFNETDRGVAAEIISVEVNIPHQRTLTDDGDLAMVAGYPTAYAIIRLPHNGRLFRVVIPGEVAVELSKQMKSFKGQMSP